MTALFDAFVLFLFILLLSVLFRVVTLDRIVTVFQFLWWKFGKHVENQTPKTKDEIDWWSIK